MSREAWTKFRGYERAKKAALPGVWRLRGGGCLIRGRVQSDKTGKMEEVCHAVDTDDPDEARQILRQELEERKRGTAALPSRMRFCDWAVSVYEERVTTGEIRSASTRRAWDGILRDHLMRPYPDGFGDVWLDAISTTDVMAWRKRCAELLRGEVECLACHGKGRALHWDREETCHSCKGVGRRHYGPRTVNQWFNKLKVIMSEARRRRLISENPTEGLKPLPTDLARTYTPEQPNSLSPEEAVVFLDVMWSKYPQWYAMTVLGMATGRRPSEMRPLRKSGPSPDLVLLPDGTAWLYIRRSHSEGKEIMERTKTGADVQIRLPAWLVDVLRWHMDRLSSVESDLLFPSPKGSGLLDEGCLYRRFDQVRRAAGFQKKITPRALRRSYQDLQRAVATPDVITRSISGHITEEMQHHYSTVAPSEQRAALEQLGKLLRFPGRSGMKGGEKQAEQSRSAEAESPNPLQLKEIR